MVRSTVLYLAVLAAPLVADSSASRLERLEALVLTQQKRIEKLEAEISQQQTVIETLRPRSSGTELQRNPEVASGPSSSAPVSDPADRGCDRTVSKTRSH